MKEYPNRKANRLKNYDYTQDGAYFITICVKDKHEILGEIVVGGGVLDAPCSDSGTVPCCELSEIGRLVDSRIQTMNNIYDSVKIEKYMIMPNHIHMIVSIAHENGSLLRKTFRSGTPDRRFREATPTNATIPSFISTLKRYTNRDCGFSFWQRSYHDHIIRNEAEYQKIWEYIDTNPIRWETDEYHI